MFGSRRRRQTLLQPAAIGGAVIASLAMLGYVFRVIRRETLQLDDYTLTAKVMSELFSDPDVPKGSIDVNSEYGVVVLRGEVRTPAQIKAIEGRVRSIAGVRDVRALLHLPKTPAKTAKGPRRVPT